MALSTTARLLGVTDTDSINNVPIESLKIEISQDRDYYNFRTIGVSYSGCLELKSIMALLKQNKRMTKGFPQESENDFSVSLKNIIALLKEFDNYKPQNKAETLLFETARAYLMKAVLEQLEQEIKYYFNLPPKQYPKSVPDSNSGNTIWHWIGFAIMMLVEFVPAFIMNWMYAGESMASLTPYLFFLSPHVLTALGIISALSMLGGMVCFIGPVLMKWIGLKYSNTNLSLLLSYQQQFDLAENIDNHLLNYNELPYPVYRAYLEFSKETGEHLTCLPSQVKKENIFSKSITFAMTALTGIQALSGSLFLAATLLGCIVGAFTLATSSPVILTAFVTSHAISVLSIATPFAISQGMMSYILRVTSASKIFDPFFAEREGVEKRHTSYDEQRADKEFKFGKFFSHKEKEDIKDQNNKIKQSSIFTEERDVRKTGSILIWSDAETREAEKSGIILLKESTETRLEREASRSQRM